MKFSIIAMILTMAVVVFEGCVSYINGTFSSKQWKHTNLSFLKHWGVSIGDLCIFPIINALIAPYLYPNWYYIPGFILALMATLLLHKSWWPSPSSYFAQGFILNSLYPTWRTHSKNHWYLAVTPEGWIHVFFMTCQLASLGGYLFTPMPKPVINIVSALLVVFLPLGVIRPGIVQSGGIENLTLRKIAEIGLTFLALTAVVLVVRFIKLS